MAARKMGSNNPAWCGGKHQSSRGYVMVRRPGHPMAEASGYVKEHRLVMAENLGRALEPQEHVHHINGDKSDNRSENLQLMSDGEHKAHHNRTAIVSDATRAKMSTSQRERYRRAREGEGS
jgi:CRISPR/Cas system CMR subunit Cmr4 (Cas7 group RAMP superfamily)